MLVDRHGGGYGLESPDKVDGNPAFIGAGGILADGYDLSGSFRAPTIAEYVARDKTAISMTVPGQSNQLWWVTSSFGLSCTSAPQKGRFLLSLLRGVREADSPFVRHVQIQLTKLFPLQVTQQLIDLSRIRTTNTPFPIN